MDIFESLENLNVSEECFDEIMGLVEELLSEKYVVTNSSPLKPGSYSVVAPRYSEKYIPGKGYTSQQRVDMENKALEGRAQELVDAANREGKTPKEIGDRRGYGKGIVAPTEKSSLDSVKAAARRKFGNDASGKRKATKAIKTQFPDFKRPKASDHFTMFGNKFKHLTY